MQLLKMTELLLGCPGKVAVSQADRIEGAGSHLGGGGEELNAHSLDGWQPPTPTSPPLPPPATLDPLVYLSVPPTWDMTGTPGANTRGCIFRGWR